MNDKMKCEKCENDLYFISNTKVFCKSCNKEYNPLEIKYKCLICRKIFSSEAKIFNSLEYDVKKIKFIHRKYCRGELFLGELNGKKVVICSKCDSVGGYENYLWTCPLCYKKFKDNDNNNIVKYIDNNTNEKNENRTISKDRISSVNKIFKKQKTSIKSVLFKNLRNNNNKENINCNINVINNKIEKDENTINNNNKSGVLKTIEKSSSGLSIHSRLFTEYKYSKKVKN